METLVSKVQNMETTVIYIGKNPAGFFQILGKDYRPEVVRCISRKIWWGFFCSVRTYNRSRITHPKESHDRCWLYSIAHLHTFIGINDTSYPWHCVREPACKLWWLTHGWPSFQAIKTHGPSTNIISQKHTLNTRACPGTSCVIKGNSLAHCCVYCIHK